LPRPTASLVVAGPADEPPVFAGPPGRLTGRLRVHNPGGVSVVLRDAGLADPSGALALPTARHAVRPVVVRPDQGGTISLTLGIDPATPSGRYPVELDVGGQRAAVVLWVAEVLKAVVTPATLVLFNSADLAQRRRLLITNAGNVGFELARSRRVELHLDRDQRPVHVALEALLGDRQAELERLAVALLAVAQTEQEPAGSLAVTITDGPVAVAPGESAFVELELKLEGSLPDPRRYRGRLQVLTQDVDVVVVPDGPGEAADPPKPRRRASSGSGRRARQPKNPKPT
jgi:hypothetical protein